MTPEIEAARAPGAINGISLAYVPGIGMDRKAARPVATLKPCLSERATRAIAVLLAMPEKWTGSEIIRAATGLENGSRCATVLCILRDHGLIETRKVPWPTGGLSAEHRPTQSGLREQAHWRAKG
jgi:hypothetical protein